MNRISVATVQAAYQATGLRPSRRVYHNAGGEACALAAVAAARSFSSTGQDWRFIALATYLNLPMAYAAGFMDGFDGFRGLSSNNRYAAYFDGYADGRAAACQCFPGNP